MSRIHLKLLGLLLVLLAPAIANVFALPARATVVRFTSNMGTFDVRMFETATPLTVNNILAYVNDGDFDDSIIHRADTSYVQQQDGTFVSAPFVIQGGDTYYPEGGTLTSIPSNPPVQNEPYISNLRGTLGLAKLPGEPNSGTNNWFVNLGNNSFLDNSNGGFTVFGRVVHDGMDVVDAVAQTPTYQVSNRFNQSIGTSVPLLGDITQGITRDNFVLFSSVEELDIPDGDYDFDGKVTGIDFLIWQLGFGSTTDLAADNNGDAVVDGQDLTAWIDNYGPATTGAAITQVPEPSSMALLALAVSLGVAWKLANRDNLF